MYINLKRKKLRAEIIAVHIFLKKILKKHVEIYTFEKTKAKKKIQMMLIIFNAKRYWKINVMKKGTISQILRNQIRHKLTFSKSLFSFENRSR